MKIKIEIPEIKPKRIVFWVSTSGWILGALLFATNVLSCDMNRSRVASTHWSALHPELAPPVFFFWSLWMVICVIIAVKTSNIEW
jgi:hypothetical protein